MSNIKPDPMRAARAIVEYLHQQGAPRTRLDIVQAIETVADVSMSDIDVSLHWLVSMRIVHRSQIVEKHTGQYSGKIIDRSCVHTYALEPATPMALVRAMRDTFQWLDAWSRSGGYELSRSLMLSDILVRVDANPPSLRPTASEREDATKTAPNAPTPHKVSKPQETMSVPVASFRHGKTKAPGGYTGDLCACGGMLKANGGCQVCVSCGSSTGCG